MRGHKASLGDLHLYPGGAIVHSFPSLALRDTESKHSPSEMRGEQLAGK